MEHITKSKTAHYCTQEKTNDKTTLFFKEEKK